MSENRHPPDERWEAFVRDTARDFAYPPTPDVVRAVPPTAAAPPPRAFHRWRLAAAALLIALVALMAVPEVRAAVLEVLRIGAVRILSIGQPADTPAPVPTATPGERSPVLDLPGETTLALVRARLPYPILLPADLGEPDRVHLQYLGGAVVTLVWLAPDDPNTAEWVLQILDRTVSASKELFEGRSQRVTVSGHAGVWLEDVHEIVFYRTSGETRRLVQAHVLVWEIGGITYRLETARPQDDALRVAESLR